MTLLGEKRHDDYLVLGLLDRPCGLEISRWNELASQHGVHPTLNHAWKKQFLAGAEELFSKGSRAAAEDHEAVQAQLYEQIGRLKMELDWVKKKLPASVEAQRALVEVGHPQLSIGRQCELLGLARSSFYYQPAVETPANLALMRLIDRQYTDRPFYGSRKMTTWLQGQGYDQSLRQCGRAFVARCLSRVTVTFSSGSAQPQIRTGTSRCKTMWSLRTCGSRTSACNGLLGSRVINAKRETKHVLPGLQEEK